MSALEEAYGRASGSAVKAIRLHILSALTLSDAIAAQERRAGWPFAYHAVRDVNQKPATASIFLVARDGSRFEIEIRRLT